MSVGRLLTPTPGEGGPPLETAALALPAVFLAGPTLPWRAEVQARLLLKYRTVVNPENETYLRLTEEGLKRQVAWEERYLHDPNVQILFWFPKDSLAPVTMMEIGAVLRTAPHRATIAVAEGHRMLRDITSRAATTTVHTTLPSAVDALLLTTPTLPQPPAHFKAGRDYLGVGAGAYVFDDRGRVLLVRRADDSKSEPGMWARPGGTVELGEGVEEALAREFLEEVNVRIEAPVLFDLTTQKGPHWVAIGYIAGLAGPAEEACNNEPHKHPEVAWFPLDALPSPLASFVVDSLGQIAKDPAKYLPPTAKPQKGDRIVYVESAGSRESDQKRRRIEE